VKEEIKEPSVQRMWHELYIEIQSDPTDTRNDREFCEELVLEYSTFRNWKTKYRSFIFREVEARRKNFRNEMRAKIYKSLVKKMDTDTNAIKLLAQLLGDLVEKSEIKTESMNDADKIRRIKSLREENHKKLRSWSGEAQLEDGSAPESSGLPAQEPGGVDTEGSNKRVGG